MNTITNTIAVVTMVSLRVGQVTRGSSWRTGWMNSAPLVLAMSNRLSSTAAADGTIIHVYIGRAASSGDPRLAGLHPPTGAGWQEWRGSNPQPPVLETGALPVELHSFIATGGYFRILAT